MAVRQMVTPTGAANERSLTEYEARTYGHEHEGRWVIRTEYEGRVLATYEKNGYDDSDFFAIVETEPGKYDTVMYGSTRGWTYLNGAEADATPEVVARYEAFRQGLAEQRAASHAEAAKRALRKGATVRVTSGKGKGTEGEIVWLGPNRYAGRNYSPFGYEGPHRFRVGVKPTDGDRVFANGDQVEVLVDGAWVEPEPPGVTIGDVAAALGAETWRSPQVPATA